jgi:hypothetical protein
MPCNVTDQYHKAPGKSSRHGLTTNRRRVMKTIIAAAGLATLIAFPAFAQSYDPSVGSGNIAPRAQAQVPTLQMRLQGA